MAFIIIPKRLVYKQADHHTIGAARKFNYAGHSTLQDCVHAVLCEDATLGLKVLKQNIINMMPDFFNTGGVTPQDWDLVYSCNEVEEDPESGVQRVSVSTGCVRTTMMTP